MVSDNKKPLKSTLQVIADQMKASEHLKDMDPTQIASAVIQGVKSAFAIQATPCHTLPEILPHLTVNKLRLLYLLHSQSDKPGKRNKQQLIDALIPMIPDPQRLMAYVLLLPAMQWDLLKKALKNAELKGTHYALDWAQMAINCGYLYSFYYEDDFVFVMPDEVKAAYKTIDNKALRDVKRFREHLNEFACGAVNLYGALTFAEFVQLMDDYVEYGRDRLTVEDLESHLIGYSMMNDDYRISKGCLVSIALTDENDRQAVDMEAVRAVTGARRGKPRYTPDVNTFLKYADPDHYEETKEVRLLKTALVSYGMDREDASWLIGSLCRRIVRGDKPHDLLLVFKENDVTLKEEQMSQVAKLVTDMSKTTRMWSNFGHTSNEITIINDGYGLRTKSLTGSSPLAKAPGSILPPRKPSRNEPCPCGSGLKYKRCCGKNV